MLVSVSSVCVSAKSGDSSVSSAINFLLRWLLKLKPHHIEPTAEKDQPDLAAAAETAGVTPDARHEPSLAEAGFEKTGNNKVRTRITKVGTYLKLVISLVVGVPTACCASAECEPLRHQEPVN